jgi:1,2-dihydroxy-3-keto-5-methylthiopentene dioxygenase
MARIFVKDQSRDITDPQAIADYLAPLGITYAKWPLEDRVDPAAAPDTILTAYQSEIDHLKQQGGYATADVININPDTPNLDTLLNKFNKEHVHSEDEVRFILRGRGVFHINPQNESRPTASVFGLEIEAGDMINVPAGTKHWFDLCSERTIRAIRLFKDTSGWTPLYSGTSIHENFIPQCWGPNFIASERVSQTAVRL